MAQTPSTNFLTQYVFENPWPLGIALLALAGALAWFGLREGIEKRTRAALVLAIIGAGVIAAGMLVTTSGERSKAVARALVEAAVSKDLVGGMALFSDDAVFNAGAPTNPDGTLNLVEFAAWLVKEMGRDGG